MAEPQHIREYLQKMREIATQKREEFLKEEQIETKIKEEIKQTETQLKVEFADDPTTIVDIKEQEKEKQTEIDIIGNRTLLFQPTEVTFMQTDLDTALEWHIVTLVVEQLQDLIKKSIEAKKDKRQMQLIFDEFQGKEEKQIFTFKFKDLNISRTAYGRVRDVLLKMQKITIDFKTKDPITGEKCIAYTGLFDEVYEIKRMDRVFRVRMKEKVMERFIEVTNQYTSYLKEIVLNIKKKHTIRIYLLMSTLAYKKTFTYSEKKLREYLGIKNDQYQKTAHIMKLLNTAKEELAKEKGMFFDYNYVSKTIETPAYFTFKISRIPKKLTKRQEEQQQQQKTIVKMLIERHFGISEVDSMKIIEEVSIDNYQAMVHKITELKKYLDKNHKQIHSRSDFALKSIQNYLKEINLS